MKVTFVGTGYVGLVTGTCFAELGHEVICVDVDDDKIETLQRGEIPIYEPGLKAYVQQHLQDGRLTFSSDLSTAVAESQVIFVAVGTPQRQDGSADLQDVWSAVDAVRNVATEQKVVVIKSTVPVGTNAKVFARLNEANPLHHSVVSNPEFLREGRAVEDALNPDRVVLGVADEHSRKVLSDLYAPYADRKVPVLFMRWESAEMTKYVANCLLATKISYINEMANMCEVVGADINDVRQGIGYDPRIGFEFFAPGVGYGGSCFPKDVRALKSMARGKKMPMRILEAVDYVNEEQKQMVFQKLSQSFNEQCAGAQVAIWGLAFKPETDDVRAAPSLVLINQLLNANVDVRVYDPQACDNVRAQIGDRIEYCSDQYAAAENSDALVIMTDWDEFKVTDFTRLRRAMKGHVIIDGRNLFDPQTVAQEGFVYSSIGRQTTYPGFPSEIGYPAESLAGP